MRQARGYPYRFAIEHIRVAHRPAEAAEETLRSRSFVFIALGLYGAQAAGLQTPLYMFENGFIALNVPLTPHAAARAAHGRCIRIFYTGCGRLSPGSHYQSHH